MVRTHRADCRDCEWRSGPMPGTRDESPQEQAETAKNGHQAHFPLHQVEVVPCG